MKLIMGFVADIGWPKTLLILAVVVALLFYVVQKLRKSSARAFVLAKKPELKEKLAAAIKEAETLGAKVSAAFSGLEDEFRPIERLNYVSAADWFARREDVVSFEKKLTDAVSTMRSVWNKK